MDRRKRHKRRTDRVSRRILNSSAVPFWRGRADVRSGLPVSHESWCQSVGQGARQFTERRHRTARGDSRNRLVALHLHHELEIHTPPSPCSFPKGRTNMPHSAFTARVSFEFRRENRGSRGRTRVEGKLQRLAIVASRVLKKFAEYGTGGGQSGLAARLYSWSGQGGEGV